MVFPDFFVCSDNYVHGVMMRGIAMEETPQK